ncbi:hypothetical protein BDW22DRAFT_1315403, partial [Trametopsis cervina]
KRRKMWPHALEKSLFTPEELGSLGAQVRRGTYTASLEAHIDRLHGQLRSRGICPVPLERLGPFDGLNSTTAKSMVAGLYRDISTVKSRLVEIQRAV